MQAGGPNRRWGEKRGDESTKGGGVVFVRVRGEKGGRRMKVRGGAGGGVRSHSMQRLIYSYKGGKVGYVYMYVRIYCIFIYVITLLVLQKTAWCMYDYEYTNNMNI
jgi:hypothetical protein